MFKNVAGQKGLVHAHNTLTDAPETGDAANITAYISKDGATPVQSNDVNPAELDSTNMPGIYVFDILQAETNTNNILLYAKSATAGVRLEPKEYSTVPPSFNSNALATAAALTTHDGKLDGVKTKTDGLNFTGSDVKATLDGEFVITDDTSRVASKADVSLLALEAKQDTILAKLLAYIQLLFRKDAGIATDNAAELTAINANEGSGAGSYVNTTDSQEATKDAIDSIPTAAGKPQIND